MTILIHAQKVKYIMNFKKKKKSKKKNKEKLNSKSFAYLKTEYYQNFEKKS